jgi:hypothetical protein
VRYTDPAVSHEAARMSYRASASTTSDFTPELRKEAVEIISKKHGPLFTPFASGLQPGRKARSCRRDRSAAATGPAPASIRRPA